MNQGTLSRNGPPAPQVSIVIPVYNGANYLREAIDSALAQSWPGCEVLVINDGSDDGGATEAIAAAYGGRIRYFVKSNGGVASALNLGIREMRGRFLAWLSHDDIFLPDKTAVQMEVLRSLRGLDPDGVFMFTAYRTVDPSGRSLYDFYPDAERLATSPMYAVFLHMINGCTTLISRELLLRAGGFADLSTTQDYDMWFRLVRLVPPLYLPRVTLLSRLHPLQGFRSAAARAEAGETFTRLLDSLTEEEILACAPTREAFFDGIFRNFCEIDMPQPHAYAIAKASAAARLRYRLSPKRACKLLVHKIGLLPYIRQARLRLRRRA